MPCAVASKTEYPLFNDMRVFFGDNWTEGFDGYSLSRLSQNLLEREKPSSRQCLPWEKERFYLREPVALERCQSIGDSDVILIPPYHPDLYSADPALLRRIERIYREADKLSREYRKPVLLHGGTRDILDYRRQSKIPIQDHVYLSTNILDHSAPANHWGLPYFIPDYASLYPALFSLEALPSLERPSVGFCGVAAPLGQSLRTRTWLFDWLRLGATYLNQFGVDSCRIANMFGTNMKHAYRARLILELGQCRKIKTDFVLRELGGLVSRQYWRESLQSEYSFSYFRNLSFNIYTICCRGTENYSIRFYEAFCVGRIPVITNTQLRLPFSDVVDYSRQCCVIEKSQLHRADKVLQEFHASNGPQGILSIMQENRSIWEKYLSFSGFYKSLARKLRR